MDPAAADALLTRLAAGKVLWLLHVNADPDCVGSAFALREGFGGAVAASGGVSRAGRALAKRVGLEIDEIAHPKNFDTIVAVDTSSRSQLGAVGAEVHAPFLVDHHAYGDLLALAPAHAWDATASSCAEVALALLDRAGRAPSRDASLALLVGLVADTARFRHANTASFAAAARLLAASGATMDDVLKLTEPDEEEDDSFSRRKATLLGTTRASVEEWGDLLVATSEVGSFDSAAAGALVRAGADLAIVTNARSATARISMRASPRAIAKGVNLGEVANAAAREVAWSGGGHEGAAGLSGAAPAEPARAAVLRLAKGRLA